MMESHLERLLDDGGWSMIWRLMIREGVSIEKAPAQDTTSHYTNIVMTIITSTSLSIGKRIRVWEVEEAL